MKELLLNHNNFALTVEILKIIQDNNLLMQTLTNLFGSKFIISGCVENGTSISSGIVCIDGEIMEFTGGTMSQYLRVNSQDTVTTIKDGSHTYTTKTCVFGAGEGQFLTSDLKRLSTIYSIIQTLTSHGEDIARKVESDSLSMDLTSETVVGGSGTKIGELHIHIVDKQIMGWFEFDDSEDPSVSGDIDEALPLTWRPPHDYSEADLFIGADGSMSYSAGITQAFPFTYYTK